MSLVDEIFINSFLVNIINTVLLAQVMLNFTHLKILIAYIYVI